MAAKKQLVLANSQNGQIIWQTGHEGRADDLVVNEERVFLTNDYRITAYQLRFYGVLPLAVTGQENRS